MTDRHRLAARVSGEVRALAVQVAAAARAGVDMVQVREPDLDARGLLDLTRDCLDAVEGTAALVIVNDRLDVALAAGAHGVHLKAVSVRAARVRTLTPPGFVIGRSVHGVDEARAAAQDGGVDYLIAGTLFPSASKPEGQPVLAPETLARLVRAATVPVLGIGGITAARVPAALEAGAAGIAGIGLFLPDAGGDPGAAAARAARAVRAAFGSAGRRPKW